MPTESQCPTREVIQSFVAASLDLLTAEEICRHLEVCPNCEVTLSALERDDTLADRIQVAFRTSDPETAGFIEEHDDQRLLQFYSQSSASSFVGRPSSQPPSIRDYDIDGILGQGGMGTVYKAVHRRLKRTVALKVLLSDRFNRPELVSRFEREMEALGRLTHPNIVQAFDAGEHDGQHYLAMELVDGENLSELVRRNGPLRVADACSIISQIAAGLQFAYENGIVHRDIKPSNLMLATTVSDPIAKILDLGLARALDGSANSGRDAEELTAPGQVLGTLDYMAPEQGGNAHQIDIRTDIYSLGATFYKLLTGESPFAAHADLPPMQRLMVMAVTDPPSVREKRTDIPEPLSVIIHRMLAKSPENRFATPASVIEALKPYCYGANLAALTREGSGQTRSPILLPQHSSELRPSSGVMQKSDHILQSESNASKRHGRKVSTIVLAVLFLMTFGILTIVTREGTIEVESLDGPLPDDLKIVVQQGGQDVGILQRDGNWKASVASGTIKLSIVAGEDAFELTESSLTVSRFGRNIVRVKTATNGNNEDAVPEQDREIARKILSLGGCVRVGPPNTPQTVWDGIEPNAIPQVYEVDQLPETPFWVYAAYIDFDAGNGSEISQEVMRLSHVAHVFFQGGMTDKDVSALNTIPQSINVAGFRMCQISASSVRRIARWKHLEQLELTDNLKIDDQCLELLKPLEGLHSLDLSGTAVSDQGLMKLAGFMPRISNLSLDRLPITDDGIQSLANLPNMMFLRMTDCPNITMDAIRRLRAKAPSCTFQFNGKDFLPEQTE